MKRKHARVKPPPAIVTRYDHDLAKVSPNPFVRVEEKASPLPNRAERREMYRQATRGRGGASASHRSALPRV